MMKRMSIIGLALCLAVLLLFAGCGKKAQPAPEPEATPAAEATPEVIVYTEPVDVVRLDSIDYDVEKGDYLLNITPLTYRFEDVIESEMNYTVKEGEPKKYTLAKDAVIDFPMLDNVAQTVSLLPGELTEEFEAYVAEYDDKPQFLAEYDGDTIAHLTHFYLP